LFVQLIIVMHVINALYMERKKTELITLTDDHFYDRSFIKFRAANSNFCGRILNLHHRTRSEMSLILAAFTTAQLRHVHDNV
jgi:hypothetical protein